MEGACVCARVSVCMCVCMFMCVLLKNNRMPPSSTINLTVAIRHDSLENSDSDNQHGGSFEISSQVNIYTTTFYNVL